MAQGITVSGQAGSNAANFNAIVPGTVQVVAYTTHAESAAFATGTTLVRVCATTACHILFGASPVATVANGIYLAANVPEYFGVTSGQKVSVIQVSAGGNLHICEAA